MDITTGNLSFFLPRISLRLAVDGQVSPCPIAKDVVHYYQDHSHGMERIEVRSRSGNAHLGHVFTDGPKTKEAYVIVSIRPRCSYSKRRDGARRLWIFVKSFEISGSFSQIKTELMMKKRNLWLTIFSTFGYGNSD